MFVSVLNRIRGAFAAAVLLSAFSICATAGETAPGAASQKQVISGGVGEGARKQLAEQGRDYGLKLVFTLSTGNFLSDVPFEVVSGSNVVISDVARGPWAFVNVSPGNYSVRATYEGLTQTRKVNVPKKGQRTLPFSWPAPVRLQEQPK
jgi:hypothetical protein